MVKPGVRDFLEEQIGDIENQVFEEAQSDSVQYQFVLCCLLANIPGSDVALLAALVLHVQPLARHADLLDGLVGGF